MKTQQPTIPGMDARRNVATEDPDIPDDPDAPVRLRVSAKGLAAVGRADPPPAPPTRGELFLDAYGWAVGRLARMLTPNGGDGPAVLAAVRAAVASAPRECFGGDGWPVPARLERHVRAAVPRPPGPSGPVPGPHPGAEVLHLPGVRGGRADD